MILEIMLWLFFNGIKIILCFGWRNIECFVIFVNFNIDCKMVIICIILGVVVLDIFYFILVIICLVLI